MVAIAVVNTAVMGAIAASNASQLAGNNNVVTPLWLQESICAIFVILFVGCFIFFLSFLVEGFEAAINGDIFGSWYEVIFLFLLEIAIAAIIGVLIYCMVTG